MPTYRGLCIWGALLVSCAAGGAAPDHASSDRPDTALRATTSSTTATPPTRQELAEIWDLSLKEWDRYRRLRRGHTRRIAERADPLTLLGAHARSDEERRRYAEQLARRLHDYTHGVQAFARAYSDAYKRLFPDSRKTASRLPGASKLPSSPLGRRTVFVATQDCDPCAKTVRRLARREVPMDIYVTDADDDQAIRDWAQALDLDPERVRGGTITLNHAPPSASTLSAAQLPRVAPQ